MRASYNPPRYEYSYVFNMTIHVNSPWFNQKTFQATDAEINQRGGTAYRETQANAVGIKSMLMHDAER